MKAEDLTPDEEEALLKTEIPTDSRGKWINSSSDTHANNGSRGKLNEAQLDERAELHAQRKHNGNPSVEAIRRHWKDKYGIEISQNSEYEWYRNNQKRVDQKIALMVESGVMPVVAVSDATLTTGLQQGARNVLESMRFNKKVGQTLCTEIEQMTDWYFLIGAKSREQYYQASDEQRAIFDERLKNQLELRKSHVDAYSVLSKSTAEQGKVLIDLMKAVSDINKNGKSHQSAIDKAVKGAVKDMGLQLAKKKELEEIDPLKPVSDDERIK